MEELDEEKLAVVNDPLHFDRKEAATQENRHRLPRTPCEGIPSAAPVAAFARHRPIRPMGIGRCNRTSLAGP